MRLFGIAIRFETPKIKPLTSSDVTLLGPCGPQQIVEAALTAWLDANLPR
jgi:hypothetical protein